jgi:alpha-beta hydrolase superfamily lysophospholipase
MLKTTFLKHKEGYSLIRHWHPTSDPRGVIHIFHGMMEHSGMYHDWALQLTQIGWAVVAHDQPGSGYSIEYDCDRDHLPKNGKEIILKRGLFVHDWIKQTFKGLPVIQYGHSMGAFVVLNLLNRNDKDSYQKVILSGMKRSLPLELNIQLILLRLFMFFLGEKSKAIIAHIITFLPLAMKIKPRATMFDWVSRNQAFLSIYLNDPLCGNVASWGYFNVLNDLLIGVNDTLNNKSSVPILVLTGEKDPLSNGGKSLVKWVNLIKKNRSITHFIVEGAHHKIENDRNQSFALDRIKSFLESE